MKGLNIRYNLLNLPKTIKESITLKATYSYLSDGTKTEVLNNSNNTGYDYMGSLIYNRNGNSYSLESTSFGGGRIIKVSMN